MKGRMLWFNEAKNYGFIEAETGERVAVAREGFAAGEVPVGRCKGLAVEFTLTRHEGAFIATEVARTPLPDTRRATRHNAARIR